MLTLVFRLGTDQYAIDSRCVVEVVPRIHVRAIPHAPPQIAGMLNYRGQVIPAIDLRQLIYGQACSEFLSTRVIVIESASADGTTRRIGLIAEHVTDTVKLEPGAFADSGVAIGRSPYLGGVAILEGQLLQSLNVDRVVIGALKDALDRVEAEEGVTRSDP